ncbi:Uncharacterised protein [Klebsiella pneumoniae]|nr:Uncharacterised protein [Klebsiella pneumoniae]VAQ51648.1 Uncharacterised protein [Klebsiella pneumoniae]
MGQIGTNVQYYRHCTSGNVVKRGSLMVFRISQWSETLKTRLTGVCHLLRT